MWILAAAAAALAGVMVWLRRRYVVIEVDGRSMRPALDPGDRVLVRRRSLRHVRTGDIVVVASTARQKAGRRPGAAARGSRDASGHAWVIKRAAAVPGDPVPASLAATVSAPAGTPVPDGRLLILGDNTTASFDSRHYGYLSGAAVLGVVVRRLTASSR
jgi:signal peptidase I